MKRALLWISLLAVSATVALAADAPAMPAAPAKEAPAAAKKTAHLAGTVLTVDAAGLALTLSHYNDNLPFKIDPDATILLAAEPAKLADLKAGLKVEIAYTREGNPPYTITHIADAATVAILAAERLGVEATIDTVGEKADGDKKWPVLNVTTAAGKKREVYVDASKDGATILKDGQPAALTVYKAGDTVMVSLARVGGTIFLKGLADKPSFTAFLYGRVLRGKVSAVSDKGLTVTVEGQKDDTKVVFARNVLAVKDNAVAIANPFKVGDEVVVHYKETVKGAVRATGVFTPESWKTFADKVPPAKTAGP
jgi:Cu/Ag efflux protein CusF